MSFLSDILVAPINPFKLFDRTVGYLEDWLIPELPEQQSGIDLNISAPNGNPLIYGQVKNVGGQIVYSKIVDPNDDDDVDNDLLYLQVVWSIGEIESIDQIYLNDIPIESSEFDAEDGGRWAHHHNYPQGNINLDWEGLSFEAKGNAYSVIRLEYDPQHMGNLPKITADIRGRKVENLETGVFEYSTNYADIIYDYLVNVAYGRGLQSGRLNKASFITERQFMDQQVYPYPDSPAYQNLMSCNILLNCNNKLLDNINKLRKGCRGFLPYINGEFHLTVERERTPLNFEITDDNRMSDFVVEDNELKDHFNKVICKYADASQKGEMASVEYPADNSTLLAEDNNQPLETTITLDTVNNPYEALQSAEIILKRSRDALRVNVTTKPTTELLGVGFVINVSNEAFGMVQKPFIINEMTRLANGLIKFKLLEYQGSIYPWNEKNEVIIPDTIVPDYSDVSPPTGLTITPSTDGTGQGVINWSSSHSSFYTKFNDNRIITTGNHFINVDNLKIGDHKFTVRAINGLGFSSPEAVLNFTISKPEIPTINYTKGNFNIEVFPVISSSYLTVTFQLMISRTDDIGTAEDKGRAGSFTIAGLSPNTTYYLWVRTINVAGISDWATANITTLNDNSELVEFLDIDTQSIVDEVILEIQDDLNEIAGADPRQTILDNVLDIQANFETNVELIEESYERKTDFQELSVKNAKIIQAQEVLFENDSATAIVVQQLETEIDDNTAYIGRLDKAYSDGDTALALSIQQFETDVNGTYATITTVNQVKSDVAGNSSAITSLSTAVGNNEDDIASANLTLQSHTSDIGDMYTRAFLGTTVGTSGARRVTGILITDSNGDNQNSYSTLEFKAAAIKFVDQNNAVQFYWDSGKNKFVFKGELLAASGTFAGQLSAASGTFTGTVSAGYITGSTFETTHVGDGWVYINQDSLSVIVKGNSAFKVSPVAGSVSIPDVGNITSYLESDSAFVEDGNSDYAAGIFQGKLGYGLIGYSRDRDGVRGVSTYNDGVQGSTSGNSNQAGVRGKGYTGVIGEGATYDFYAAGSGTNYAPFTGSHDGLVAKTTHEFEQGDIVCDSDLCIISNISNAITSMVQSSKANDKSARGVIVFREPLNADSLPAALDDDSAWLLLNYDRIGFNALGEGVMNVCGEGGNIEIGDLITSSNMIGKGMKQLDQDNIKPYTVAQSRQKITFSSANEVKQIAVIYKCG